MRSRSNPDEVISLYNKWKERILNFPDFDFYDSDGEKAIDQITDSDSDESKL